MEKYKNLIDSICNNIHSDLIDFSIPRSKTSMPTQASSEFITKKQQGDWAEEVLFRAINDNCTNIVAVRYGKSDELVAGDNGFDKFFQDYQNELDTIGKRPDLLLFKIEDFDKSLGYDISSLPSSETSQYVSKAVAGIEVRSSAFLINKYTEEANKTVKESTERAIELKDIVFNKYLDLLEQKRPELIPILQQLNETSARTLDFRLTSWCSSTRLIELSSLLSDIKKCLKIVQKRQSLSITPKVEDLKVVYKWIMTYNVPHYYVQVFFDRAYGISFQNILELIANPDLEDVEYFIEADSKNQNKTVIKIPAQNGICIAQTVTEPQHRSVRKELNKGRLLFYVTFDGGNAYIDSTNFASLFGVEFKS